MDLNLQNATERLLSVIMVEKVRKEEKEKEKVRKEKKTRTRLAKEKERKESRLNLKVLKLPRKTRQRKKKPPTTHKNGSMKETFFTVAILAQSLIS